MSKPRAMGSFAPKVGKAVDRRRHERFMRQKKEKKVAKK